MKVNDTKLYFFFSLITLLITIVLSSISFYSIILIEPEAKRLIKSQDNINENFRKAYAILRNPQLFARYENFDREARWIRTTIIPYMDNKIYYSRDFTPDEKEYLLTLLARRQQGSELGRNTSIFFLLLTLLGFGFYFFERYKVKKEQSE
jgi:hypothetical protein